MTDAVPFPLTVSPPAYVAPNFTIYRAWDALPPAPIVANNLDPPISGPAPTNPPFAGGARVRSEVLVSWLPPAPAPIVGPKFTSGIVVASNPPFAGGAKLPLEVLIGWLAPPPAPITGPKFTLGAPQNPPFTGGARVSTEIQIGWLAAPYAPIAGQKLPNGLAAPPSLPLVGAQVPLAVQVAWMLPQPASIVAVRRNPPISGPAPQNPPFAGGASVRREITIAWLPPDPAAIVGPNLPPPPPPPPPPGVYRPYFPPKSLTRPLTSVIREIDPDFDRDANKVKLYEFSNGRVFTDKPSNLFPYNED